MKNQNDLIAWIVSGVLTIIFVVICFAVIERQPQTPVAPQTVATDTPKLPTEQPVLAASLPNGGSTGVGGLSGMMGGRGGPMGPGMGRAGGMAGGAGPGFNKWAGMTGPGRGPASAGPSAAGMPSGGPSGK